MRSPGKPWKGNIARSRAEREYPKAGNPRINTVLLDRGLLQRPKSRVHKVKVQLYILGFHHRICVKFSTCLPEFVHVREHGLAMIFNHSSFDGLFRYGQGGCLCRQLFLVTKDPLFAQVHCCEALLLRVISLGCIRCQLHKLKISSSLSISLQAMSELRVKLHPIYFSFS